MSDDKKDAAGGQVQDDVRPPIVAETPDGADGPCWYCGDAGVISERYDPDMYEYSETLCPKCVGRKWKAV